MEYNEKIIKTKERFYRSSVLPGHLQSFRVVVKETDLFVSADKDLSAETKELVLEHRSYLENYIKQYPDFLKTLSPWKIQGPAPKIVRDMIQAGNIAGVGPMASVAGAIAEIVGNSLLKFTNELIIENGGDIFIKINHEIIAGIYAGKSELSNRIAIKIKPSEKPIGLCTSSGTVGHSLSFGKADAVTVLSDSASIADAAATSIGNLVREYNDIKNAIEFAKTIKQIYGVLIIIDNRLGVWGNIELVPL